LWIDLAHIRFQVFIYLWAVGEAPIAGAFLVFIKAFTVISHTQAAFLYAVMGWADVVPFVVGYIIDADMTLFLFAVAFLSYVILLLFVFVFCWGFYVLGVLPSYEGRRGLGSLFPCFGQAQDETEDETMKHDGQEDLHPYDELQTESF
jgi:hypothetical protein